MAMVLQLVLGKIQSEMEITNGVTTTDKEGKFKVEFELVPDLSMQKETKPVFSYTVYADVIDVTGETHSAQTYVSAGYVALVANINIPEIVKSDSIVRYQVSTTNLNGQFEPAPISIEVYRLKIRIEFSETDFGQSRINS